MLQAFDHTGVAINKPDPFAYVGQYNQDQIEAERWSIEVEPESFSGPK